MNEKFEEMTSAASRADEAEKGAEQKLQEVEDKEKVLLKTVTDGVELTTDGIVEFKNLVQEALKQEQEAKKSYQMYGTTCLNVMGLGRKLPLVKFQNKMESSVKVKCRFCDKDYVEFVRLSEHMLRAHHEEFDDLVKGVLVRGEASEGSSEKSTSIEGKSGESSQKGESSEKGKSNQKTCKW